MKMDTFMISNWGNYPKVEASLKSFKNVKEIGEELQSDSSYIARGNGRCYGDSSLNTCIISTLKYDKILEFDQANAIITCQAGLTFESLIQFLVPRGLFLPVTPGTKFITVGGAVASDIHGKNHHVDGSFGDHIIKMEILLASGKVVECARGQEGDLFDATCGGMGLTGIILSVKFKLKKINSAFIKQTSIKAKDLDEIFELFDKYKANTYSVAWIDCLQRGNSLGRSLLMVGEHATEKESSPLPKANSMAVNKKLNVPINFPMWVLNKYSIKIFNFLFYHKQLKKRKESVVTFDQFFYPLDFINNWNRMYGKKGFVQYQFVLPLENSKVGLRKILTEIGNNGTGSFLAVLKLFGEQERGLISFPMRGYTLALDFPVREGLFVFLDHLDKLVLEYGGRIYLTKDARMNKQVFWKSYPKIDRFQEIVKKVNPHFKWRSVQSDRLEISKP
jgi:decaprenylphospho-beta-D-ribofuranose 2-oxidase